MSKPARRTREPKKVPGIENRERKRRDGTIYWTFRVRWIDPTTGERRGEEFDDQAEAIDFKATLRLAKRSGRLPDLSAGRMTLKEFAAEWWTTYAAVELERGTLKSYRPTYNLHILPRLGHLQLRQIDPALVLRWRGALEADGVGLPTVRKAMAILQSILARAVEWGYIPTNAPKEVRKPTVPKAAVRPWPPLMVEQIIAALHDDLSKALVATLAYSGLRPEEALALQWQHVRKGTILVEQKLVDGEIVTGQKTKKPPRTVDLLKPLAADLAAYRLAQPTAALPTALVFPALDGGPWPDHAYRNWRRRTFTPVTDSLVGRPTLRDVQKAKRMLTRAQDAGKPAAELTQLAQVLAVLEQTREQIPGIRPYDLRHSFASLLIHEGRHSVAQIADQMGHSVQTLLSTYTHLINELKDQPKVSAQEQIEQAQAEIRSAA